jgi:sigma-E factor negative regulatory protein RseC
MLEEEGIVIETLGPKAKVQIEKKSACESCSAAAICHPPEHDYLEAFNTIGAARGQKVKVIVQPEQYLKASIILYGVPLVVFLGVVVIGKILAVRLAGELYSDLWAFIAACAATSLTYMLIIRYHGKNRRSHTYDPVIKEIIQ